MLAVDGFEGPLDWLLELARAERIDLRKLSIRALVEAFAAALERALAAPARADLSRWGEFLAMAAQLTLLRSRLLLPPDDREAKAAREEAEALRRQLLDGDAMRRAAAWLDGPDAAWARCVRRGVSAGGRRRRAGGWPTSPICSGRAWSCCACRSTRKPIAPPLPHAVAGAGSRPRASYELRGRGAVASTLLAGLEVARASAAAPGQSSRGARFRSPSRRPAARGAKPAPRPA